MPSLIADYEYDILISYRQKDNLPAPGFGRQANDVWVTDLHRRAPELITTIPIPHLTTPFPQLMSF